jgi:hypothetical protein
MGARTKLNRIIVIGCILLAGILGAASDSFGVFVFALAILIGLCLYGRDIRPDPEGQSLRPDQYRRRRRRSR